MTVFQTRLIDTMTDRGMTSADLARKSGLSEAVISNYRSGKYEPKNKKLYLLATALNVSPSWLMGYDLPENEESLDSSLSALWADLTDDQKAQVLDYMRFLATNHK